MVVFTCNHCGETLHKPKVEKHYQFQCRNYKSVTCVDCFKDFQDEEYVVHTKCITEDERYAAKGTYKNGIVKKGEVKQESWLETIRSICDAEKNLKTSVRNLLNTISGYSNVPRKENKFMNFIKSSSGGRVNMNDIEEVWNIIEKHKNVNQPQKKVLNDKRDSTVEELKETNIKELSEEKDKKDIGDKKKKIDSADLQNGDNQQNSKKKRKIKLEHQHIESTEPETQNGDNPKKKKKKAELVQEVESEDSADLQNGDNQQNSKKKRKIKPEHQHIESTEPETQNGDNPKKKKKKAELVQEVESEATNNSGDVDAVGDLSSKSFDFKQNILEILSAKGGEVSAKKLQKKVLKVYANIMGETVCSDKTVKKYNKKLKKMPNVKVEDEKVILVN